MESPEQPFKKEGSKAPTKLKLGNIIGHGAFGIIFDAFSANFGPLAVKIIFHPPTQESEKILREGLVMNLEPHDNIVAIKHFLQKSIKEKEIQEIFGKRPLNSRLNYMKNFAIEGANSPGGIQMTQICMELCGKTVAEWIASTPKKHEMSTKLLQVGICVGTRDGLKFLHDKGIVHRDLKPLNIMFSFDEEDFMLPVKIGDFGLARFLHTEESLTSNVGTLAYMAPEVLTKKYDQQSDLYSLGCVIWEVVSLLSARKRQERWHQVADAKEGANIVEGHTYVHGIEEDIVNLTSPDKSARTKTINDLRFIPTVTHVFVSSTYELQLALLVATDGAVIHLAKGTFKGNFVIKQSRLTIVGAGEGTILTGDSTKLKILGTGCILLHFSIMGNRRGTGIQIMSDNCCLAHLTVVSHDRGIQVNGNYSYLTNLEICNVECAIWINGRNHLVKNCYIHEAIRGVRAYCKKGGKRTVISGLRYSCCEFALHLDGEYFIIDNVCTLNSQAASAKTILTSVQISARNSMLNKVDISEGSNINFLSESADCILLDSKCGRLTVNGKGHFFSDINVYGTIELLGSNMEMRNCKFQSMTASKNTNFGSVTAGDERNMLGHQLNSYTHWKDVQTLIDISKRNPTTTVDRRLQEVAEEFKDSFQMSVESVLSNYTNALQEGVKEYGPCNYPDDIVKREVQLEYKICRRIPFGSVFSIAVQLSSGLMLYFFQDVSMVQTKVVKAAHPNLPILLSVYQEYHRNWDLSTTEPDAERHGAKVRSIGEVLLLGIPRMDNPAEVTITMQLETRGFVTVSATYGVGDERQDLDVMEIASPTGLEMFRPMCSMI